MAIGFMMVMSVSQSLELRGGKNGLFYISKHLFFILIGICIMFYFAFLSGQQLANLGIFCFICCHASLIYMYFFGVEINGSVRWLYFFNISIQPSEIMKPFFLIMLAWVLNKGVKDEEFPAFRIAFFLLVITIAPIISQPDFGMSIIFIILWFTMVMLSGIGFLWLIILGIFAILFIMLGFLLLPHVADRVMNFLDSGEKDFQVQKSLEAFKIGKIFGVGPGEGELKYIIPDSHTDFIFAVASEEMGMMLCLFIMVLYGTILIRPVFKNLKNKEPFIFLCVVGASFLITIQALINISVSTGLLPSTGVTLPFISYGGSSFVSSSILAGIILSFTKKHRVVY